MLSLPSFVKEYPYRSWQDLLGSWPDSKPIFSFVGKDGWALLALEIEEVPWEDFEQQTLMSPFKPLSSTLPFIGGYVGLVSYDAYAPFVQHPHSKTPCRAFRVDAAILVHEKTQKLYMVGNGNIPCSQKIISNQAYSIGALTPFDSDQAYLKSVAQIKEDILSGDFYQLNLLRFFHLDLNLSHRPNTFQKLLAHRENFSTWVDLPDLKLLSLSPERFVSFEPENKQTVKIQAHPIKGTAPRGKTPEDDHKISQALLTSAKDLAELHMIVDLMANDLRSIGIPHTVQVLESHRLETFHHLHHLVARIEGLLPGSLSFGDFFRALCPGGSITGAPKREVTKKIALYESKNRGFFMGHAFYYDPYQNRFDSSVLIRTLVEDKKGAFYAAGSGITRLSLPEQELSEVVLKSSVFFKEK
jgi:anthranilate/para-aminobenzoate synthase component I